MLLSLLVPRLFSTRWLKHVQSWLGPIWLSGQRKNPFSLLNSACNAWADEDLFSGDEVGDGLLSLSDKGFWEKDYRRELLHLLKRRWHELPLDQRELVERRLVNGRLRYDGESEENFEQRRPTESAMVLDWLVNQGCELGRETRSVLPSLRSADPRWRPEWAETADESRESRVVSIETDSDPSPIIDAPISQIIPLARQHTTGYALPEFTIYSPFDGLVEQTSCQGRCCPNVRSTTRRLSGGVLALCTS